MSESKNFENTISILDSINKENTVSIYVPSLKRVVAFKGITTGQQKSLLKAAVDNPVFRTRFIMASHNIIFENCEEKEILAGLTSVDSLAIMIQYRAAIYGTVYEVEEGDDKYTLDLAESINRIHDLDLPGPKTIVDGQISITVGVPLMTDQYNVENALRRNDLNKVQNSENLNETIGEAFIGEVSKFIKSVVVTVDGTVHDLKYETLSPAQKYIVLEKIPSITVKNLIAYLDDVATKQRHITRLTGKTSKGVEKQIDYIVDSALFAIN